jgi:hypothetical protein
MRWSLVLLPLASCSVDSPPPDDTAFATCEEISLACHNVDVAEEGGIGEDCHIVSHRAAVEAVCLREKAICLAYCNRDGGAFDATDFVDSGSRIVEAYVDAGDAGDAGEGGSDR